MAAYRKLSGSTFGMTWRNKMRRCPAPAARAAHTKGRVRNDSTWARMTRAVVRHRKNTTSRITRPRLGRVIEITTIAKGRNGMPKATSVNRINTSSIQPPK